MGVDKCVIFDTGCDTADYKAFLDANVNTKGLPYYVICSHVHFDHISGCVCVQELMLSPLTVFDIQGYVFFVQKLPISGDDKCHQMYRNRNGYDKN